MNVSDKAAITGVVLSNDGERLLRQCLSSLYFCSEILLIDCGSKDATLDIGAAAGVRILHRSWTGFADQFTFAASEVKTPWFFILDQDEVVSKELAEFLSTVAKGSTEGGIAYAVPRRSWYFDRFMKHGGWMPDFVPRLFQTGRVTFSQDAHIHYHPEGPIKKVLTSGAEIIHYPYTGFAHQLSKLNSYAESGAENLRARGRKGGVARGITHGLSRFVKLYLIKLGFLDGRAGFLAAAHGAFYAFLKYIRVPHASWGEPFDAVDFSKSDGQAQRRIESNHIN